MLIRNKKKIFCVALGATLSAWAINEEPIILEEFTVRSDLLQRSSEELAQSVTVASGRNLEEKAVQHWEDFIKNVPSLTFTGGSSRARFLQIRSVGEFDTYEDPVIPAVGLTLDEVDYAGLGVIGSGFGLEQIEVFRGPQAGRYGSSALAGSVNLYSLSPSDEKTGLARVGVSERGGSQWGATVGMPLGKEEDGLSLRLTYQQVKEDGFMTNDLTGEKGNFIDEKTFYSKLRWQQNVDTSWELFTHYFDINNGYDAFSVNNTFATTSDFPGRDAFDIYTLGLTGQFNAPTGFDLRSITYASKRDSYYSFDSDWQSLNNFEIYDREKTLYSQEFRLVSDDAAPEKWAWSAGARLAYAEEDSYNVENYDDFFFRTERFNEYEDTNITVYGEVQYALTEVFRLNGSLRVENRQFDFADRDLGSTGLGPLPSGRSLSIDEWLWGGQLGMEYDVRENHTAFFTLSKGYRGSGFNTDPFNFAADNEKYDDESLYSAELGWRGNPRDDLRYRVNLFYQHREDAQIRRFGGIPFFEFATANADDSYAYGLETEVVYFLTDAWKWELSASLMQSEVELAEVPVLAEGRESPFAPSYKVTLSTDYSFKNGFFLGADVTAMDEHFFDAYHNVKSEAYEIFSLRSGFRTENWEILVWVKNLFDQTYATRALNFSQILAPENGGGFTDEQGFFQFGAPRTIGVQAIYRF